jgi:hypothetical protein
MVIIYSLYILIVDIIDFFVQHLTVWLKIFLKNHIILLFILLLKKFKI